MMASLRVGVGRVNITPPLGTLLMGYPDPYGKRGAESVRDPLNATALAFAQDGRRAAIVSADVCIIHDEFVSEIRQKVQEKTGIPATAVTVCATQTHSAPRTQRTWGWSELDYDYINGIMVPGIVDAIVQADASMRPARMGVGMVHSEVGINRRRITAAHEVGLGNSEWAVYDPWMTVLRFESSSGTLANLVHYGAHPTVYGGWSKVVSRDWPGIMIDRMEQLTRAKTLFINGAVGDIAPRSNSMQAVGDNEMALLEVGCAAAMDAMKAWRSIRDLRDVELHVESKTFDMPYRPLPSLEEARTQLAAFEADKDKPGRPMANYKYWSAVIESHGKPVKTAKPFDQVVTALGPAAFVPFPGEPFGETTLRLRDFSPFQYTLCASTSCGNNGYFPTRESLHRGGYEVWINRAVNEYILVEHIDDVLVERNLEMLKAAFTRMYPPIKES